VKEIDILTVSMAHALASVGGLCVGTTEVHTKKTTHRHKLSRPKLHHP
jgi:7-keto-8-aminopelargonate synthetase-like enzyme